MTTKTGREFITYFDPPHARRAENFLTDAARLVKSYRNIGQYWVYYDAEAEAQKLLDNLPQPPALKAPPGVIRKVYAKVHGFEVETAGDPSRLFRSGTEDSIHKLRMFYNHVRRHRHSQGTVRRNHEERQGTFRLGKGRVKHER